MPTSVHESRAASLRGAAPRPDASGRDVLSQYVRGHGTAIEPGAFLLPVVRFGGTAWLVGAAFALLGSRPTAPGVSA
ncbi:hypothetical protein ACQKM2_20400 [Streptomyces sp. NPDC004126]|uniref:hypothetical protein n=1 Tax=Streptomyces sp. NPDC004126 TaxID=3390695 RepID=UPI003D038D30